MDHRFSILIISYNRPTDLLELLSDMEKLEQRASLLKEVIIINNNSPVSYDAVTAFINDHPATPYKYFYSDENKGVSGGRNLAMSMATAPLFLLLDDDVLLPDPLTLVKLNTFFNSDFAAKNNVAALTPAIYYAANDQPQVNGFPHKKFKKYFGKKQFLTAYFIGAAHVLKKEAIDRCGNLPEDFFYGMEEYDLSYRLVLNNYTLAYDNSVKVLHKESPGGRLPEKKKLSLLWFNKSKVAYTYLPVKYFYTTAFMWSLLYFKKFFLNGFFKTWKQIFRIPRSTNKHPLGHTQLQYLRDVEARPWY